MSRLNGVAQVRRNLQTLAKKYPDQVARAQYIETEIESTECKRRTPVDTGALRSTIHVQGPDRQGKNIVTRIVAGGPAAPYAVAVHEDLEAFHPVGEAKYIENPLNESAPHMPGRIARRAQLNQGLL